MKAVLFDMDGVLVDSHDAWYYVINGCRKAFKYNEISSDDFDKDIWARPLDSFVERYFPKQTLEELNEQRRCLIDDGFRKLEMNDNVEEVLGKLKENGIKTAVVSNNGIGAINKILDKFGIKDYFDEIIHVGIVDKPKPAPDSILKALDLLGLSKEEVLFVGDTIFDKEAAKNAYVKFVGFKIDGDYRIDDMKQLLGLI